MSSTIQHSHDSFIFHAFTIFPFTSHPIRTAITGSLLLFLFFITFYWPTNTIWQSFHSVDLMDFALFSVFNWRRTDEENKNNDDNAIYALCMPYFWSNKLHLSGFRLVELNRCRLLLWLVILVTKTIYSNTNNKWIWRYSKRNGSSNETDFSFQFRFGQSFHYYYLRSREGWMVSVFTLNTISLIFLENSVKPVELLLNCEHWACIDWTWQLKREWWKQYVCAETTLLFL